MTDFDVPNNNSSMKFALKSVPGLADVWVPHGVEDGPRTLAPGSRSKMHAYPVDQHEKLKGLGARGALHAWILWFRLFTEINETSNVFGK